MPMSHLELVSSYGDQTLAGVRFVVHGTSNAGEAQAILESGLRIIPGSTSVSTNLAHAQDWTLNSLKQPQSLGAGTISHEIGSVIVCAVPSDFYLGYGIFTTAYVDRA